LVIKSARGITVGKEVKINLGVPESLSKDLKEIAKGKGMKFHAFLNQELTKVANRNKKG